MTVNKKDHPQKALSKEWIVTALMEIMRKKPYKQINVTELSRRAGLARRTFYRHFKTIDDVLNYSMEKMCDEYVRYIEKRETVKPFLKRNLVNGVLMHFTFWEKHKDYLNLLKENDLLLILLQNFLLRFIKKMTKSASTNENEYITYFLIGGQWNLLIKWMEDGATLTPQEMARMAGRINEIFGKC